MASSCSLAATEDRYTWCLLNLDSWCQQTRSQLDLQSNFWQPAALSNADTTPSRERQTEKVCIWSIHKMPYGPTAWCCLVPPVWVCQQTQVNYCTNQVRGRSERAWPIQGIQQRGKFWKDCVEMAAMAFGTSVTLKSFLLQNSVTGVTLRACSRNVNSYFSTKCHHRGYIKFPNTAGWVKPLELL